MVNHAASAAQADETARGIEAAGRRAAVIQADVGDKAAVDAMVDRVLREFGRLDILVNNAGMTKVCPSIDVPEKDWRRLIDVLLSGVFFCSQAAARAMFRQKSGKIINIASVAGMGAFPERAAYGSAKAGVIELTRVLGCEWAHRNINVNAIAPGYIKTYIIEDLIAKGAYREDSLTRRIPQGRLGKPEHIADAAVFLASGESDYINGQTIAVDGGFTAYSYLESWLQDKHDQ